MSGRPVKKGTTNVSSVVRIIDSSDGTPETGVVAATGGLAFNYRREAEAAVAITGISDLALLTTAHTDGGIKHIGDGYYRIDFQDAAFAAGAGEDGVLLTGTATNMIVIGTYHPLVDYDPYDTIRMGLTALPAAAADAAGGLPISDAGALDLDAMNTNINDIETDTAAMQPLVAKIPLSDGTISWNATALGAINAECDTALTDYDGPTDAEMIARTILSASYFDPAADVVATVTTVTNQITAATMADAIWDEALAGHVGPDSTGLVLNEWQDGGRLDVLLDAIPITAMRGTDSAALASVATEARLAELDAANLPAVTDGIQTDLDNATDGLGALKTLIDALNDVSTSDVLTQVNTALDAAIVELGVAAPTATPTIRTGLMLLYMALRNKIVVQTSGVDALELYNNAGTKIAAKLLTDDGDDYTEAEMA